MNKQNFVIPEVLVLTYSLWETFLDLVRPFPTSFSVCIWASYVRRLILERKRPLTLANTFIGAVAKLQVQRWASSLPGAPGASGASDTKEVIHLGDLFVLSIFKTKHGIGERTLLFWERSGQFIFDFFHQSSVLCVVKYAERKIRRNFEVCSSVMSHPCYCAAVATVCPHVLSTLNR